MTNEYYGAHTDLVPGTKARSGDINTMDQAIVEAFDKLPSSRSMKSGTMNYAVNTSVTPNLYAVTMDSSINSYVDGLEVQMKPGMNNTGSATLNVNGIGNVVLRRQDGANVQAGDILAQGPMSVIYNASTNAFVIGPTGNAHVSAAAASAMAASQSANSADASADSAEANTNTAIAKAAEAATSAATASTKAAEAAASASTATSKASEAVGSANAAAGSASAAATSATNLANAVTSASQSAGTASTKAGEAAGSATAAATSAINLANAVAAAQAAQSLAQQWSSGSGIVANGKYSAEYYAAQAAALAGQMATGQINADWNETNNASKAFILNKPSITNAGNFTTGAANSIAANTNALRTITNPATGLGYAGGVRFRYGYINDADTSGGTADIADFSTYTDSTGGGVNALYLRKDQQRITHKFAGAGATAWTVQTLAYLSDLTAYLKADGSVPMTAKLQVRGIDTARVFESQNASASNAVQVYVEHNGTAANIGNARGTLRLIGTADNATLAARATLADNATLAATATTATNATNAANADKLGGVPLAGTGTGSTWPVVPRVASDGVMEVGAAIDFHNTSADGADNSVRLSTGATTTDLFISPAGQSGSQILHAGINRTNYKGVTDSFVAGQLMWAANGNSHTVFDASAGVSPTGAAVNATNPTNPWVGSYPVLMGWTGSTTCGVRVDSARVADTVASGATITNALLVNPTIKGYAEQLQLLNPSTTVTLNPQGLGTLIEMTTTQPSTAITLPTPVPGLSYTLAIRWGATGHTATFIGGGLRWANGGTVPTSTSVANKIDGYVMTCLTSLTVGRDAWRNA